MSDKNKIKYDFIDNSLSLNGAMKELEDSKMFYIDTEFVSNRDSNTLCMVQISNGKKLFLVDTIKLKATLELTSILCAEDCTWILHSGHGYIYHLVKYFNLTTLPKIFDTQVACKAVINEDLTQLANAVRISYEVQLGEGMNQLLEVDNCIAQKYCGGGWGGYALYLFSSKLDREKFVNDNPQAKPIEPFMN